MPKLPVLSGAHVVRAWERHGFAQVRQRGSHIVLQRGSVGTVPPLHKKVKQGTLAGILRQAQLGQDESLGAVR